MSNGSFHYITAHPNKSPSDFHTAPNTGGDVDPTDKLYAANPHAKVLSASMNGWTLNRQMGEAIKAIVTQYNIMKHGQEGADAFIIQWRLWPNAESEYVYKYGHGGIEKEEHDGCGCGCGG